MMYRLLTFLFFGFGLSVLGAAQVPTHATLKATVVTLDKEEQPLQAILQQISSSGLRVEDRRREKQNPTIELPFQKAPFWQAVDAVAQKANLGLSLYQADGVVALVDGPYRALPLSYHDQFRNALKRITLSEDLEAGQRTCVLSMEIAWEPRLQPFLIGMGPCTVEFSKDAAGKVLQGELRGGEQVSVVDRPALEVELRFPAPKRSAANIAKLKGNFHVIAPSKMLTFQFDHLNKVPLKKVAEGVTVQIAKIATNDSERWTIDVLIDLPPGGPKFQSYQLTTSSSWLSHNKIVLEKKEGAKVLRLLPEEESEEQLKLTSTHAHVRYHFTKKRNFGKNLGNIGYWTLIYQTPGPLVELQVPFAFKDVPLP